MARDPKFVPFYESNALIAISRELHASRGELAKESVVERKQVSRNTAAGEELPTAQPRASTQGDQSDTSETSSAGVDRAVSSNDGCDTSAGTSSSSLSMTSTTSTSGDEQGPPMQTGLLNAYREFGLIEAGLSDTSSGKVASQLEESVTREMVDLKAVMDAVNHLLDR
jgi:hypothetical protein